MITETVYLDTTIPSFYFDEQESFKKRIVAVYIENLVMPKSLVGDAIHLAYAS